MPTLGMDRSKPLIAVLPEPSADPPRSRWERTRLLSVQIKGLSVAQFPNAPLGIWLVAKLAAAPASGSLQSAANLVATVALAIWGLLELATGVNWFRRGVGLLALIALVFYN